MDDMTIFICFISYGSSDLLGLVVDVNFVGASFIIRKLLIYEPRPKFTKAIHDGMLLLPIVSSFFSYGLR